MADHFFTFDKDEVLNDPEIDVIVELIDDAAAAYEIVKAALQKGKAVVTANKKMLAEHLEEIFMKDQYAEVFLSSEIWKSITTMTSFRALKEFSMVLRIIS